MLFLAFAALFALQFSTGVSLVEVYASVSSQSGAPVTDLEASDFTVAENGVEQKIETFSRGEFPLAVVLAIDRSFSMEGQPLRLARNAARTFLGELRPQDQALVVAVGSEVEPMGDLSTDRGQQNEALNSLTPWGTTSLHDAIVDVVGRVSEGHGRRAVIILSDGRDRYSRATAADVKDTVRNSDVLVYGITLAKERSPLFEELATLSGGHAFHITTPQQFEGVFHSIALELRTQYLLGYQPPAGKPGWRSIEVRVKRPNVTVRSRSGYVAP